MEKTERGRPEETEQVMRLPKRKKEALHHQYSEAPYVGLYSEIACQQVSRQTGIYAIKLSASDTEAKYSNASYASPSML